MRVRESHGAERSHPHAGPRKIERFRLAAIVTRVAEQHGLPRIGAEIHVGENGSAALESDWSDAERDWRGPEIGVDSLGSGQLALIDPGHPRRRIDHLSGEFV